MTAVVNEAVIQFTEAKIELYEIIEVEKCFPCVVLTPSKQLELQSGYVGPIERAPDWGGRDEGCCHPHGANDQDHQLCKVFTIHQPTQ